MSQPSGLGTGNIVFPANAGIYATPSLRDSRFNSGLRQLLKQLKPVHATRPTISRRPVRLYANSPAYRHQEATSIPAFAGKTGGGGLYANSRGYDRGGDLGSGCRRKDGSGGVIYGNSRANGRRGFRLLPERREWCCHLWQLASKRRPWIPAFAGKAGVMTAFTPTPGHTYSGEPSWIPAEAGMTERMPSSRQETPG